MTTVWLEQQASNRLKPTINKRKRSDHNDLISNKRKIVNNHLTKNDSDDDDDQRLTLSPRTAPILRKTSNRSFSSMTLFRCQLCRRCLRNKDIYMDHMIICAVQCQASIKIVRAVKDEGELAIL